MFQLFRQHQTANAGGQQPGQWGYVKKRMAENLAQYKAFYHGSAAFVDPTNVLVDLLYHLGVSMSLPVERYYSAVSDNSYAKAMVFGLVSPANRGRVRKPVFFGPQTCEVLVLSDEPVDPHAVTADWQNQTAVQVLTHPFTSLEFPTPFAVPTHNRYGVVVIAINLAQLAVQYRAFVLSQLDQEDQDGVTSFIAKYVWPNMLGSYFEQVWFNRLDARLRGEPVVETQYGKTPFSLVALDSQVAACEDLTLEYLGKQSKNDVTWLLKTIPAFQFDSLYDALMLPRLLGTNQISWALDLSRLRHLLFALKAAQEGAYKASRDDVTECVRSLQHNSASAFYKAMLPAPADELALNWVSSLMGYYQK